VFEHETLKDILGNLSLVISDYALAFRIYEILDAIRNEEQGHGITIVLGYSQDVGGCVASMAEDVFESTCEHVLDIHMKDRIRLIREVDGVILVSPSGQMVHSGIFFIVNPLKILKDTNVYKKEISLPEQFGFARLVGTRHICSISASYYMPGTLVFTLSENGEIRIFNNGRIIFSEIPEEMPAYKLGEKSEMPCEQDNEIITN
jgi:DNA integrity scanning protein DisA with diadenylate cyclase activity